ncbi:hypothetical protein NL676_001765 [Syzygium grande]|nr:hypothetical protein NL676_001765 [Syzygium grande]
MLGHTLGRTETSNIAVFIAAEKLWVRERPRNGVLGLFVNRTWPVYQAQSSYWLGNLGSYIFWQCFSFGAIDDGSFAIFHSLLIIAATYDCTSRCLPVEVTTCSFY